MLVRATFPLDDITFVLHTSTHAVNEAAIREALKRANPDLAAYNFVSLDEAASRAHTTERFIFVLVASFGVLGLLLAAVGLYGLLSLQVARREREFGIRSALGATAAQLIQLVSRQGASLLACGFAAGAVATWAVAKILQNQWTAMPAPNLLAGLVAGIVLAVSATVACWLPARRASRVDPVEVLRSE
jgi:ABC-type antimicrobial peptide transport system permease subunit